MDKKDLTNQVFGRWKVIKEDGKNSCGQIMWLCECSCGNHILKRVASSSLINGSSTSCGCSRQKCKKYNLYYLSGNYGIGITINTKKEFYFDLEDYPIIKNYCWWENDSGYVITQIKRKTVRLHRLVMNCPDEYQIDHIYHNTLDNRKSQLRIVSNQENNYNKKVIGVYYDKNKNKYVGQLTYNSKKYFKRFKTFEDAFNYRKELEDRYFGKFKYREKELI
jgi:hypothetical protein